MTLREQAGGYVARASGSVGYEILADGEVSRVNFEKANFFQGRRPFPIPGKNTRSPGIVP